jgi:hypothetical protein
MALKGGFGTEGAQEEKEKEGKRAGWRMMMKHEAMDEARSSLDHAGS